MASSGSVTATMNGSSSSSAGQDLPSSHLLASSLSSLSQPARHASSQISKIYRQASTLFLTRRLPEALSTILPVITPPASEGHGEAEGQQPVPVATASRSTRIKVWSLYLTILNAVLELDPDEGKEAFGSQEWRRLVTKVRDGEVWEEVVRNGYHGREGDVDADVIINLSTILLSHARTQTLNQQRLETYLATSHTPTLDISARLTSLTSPSASSSSPPPPPHRPSPSRRASHGTNTPRDLTTRVRILELFTLHVLRRNDEWDYAHAFITASRDLDDERRDAFLHALQQLHDEDLAARRDRLAQQRRDEEQRQRDLDQARRRRLATDAREAEARRTERERRRDADGSEGDYGLEQHPLARAQPGNAPASSKPQPLDSSSSSPPPQATPAHPEPAGPAEPTRAQKLRNIVAHARRALTRDPTRLLRALAFVVGVLTLLGRRRVRERLGRVVGRGWGRVVATAGMGVKVSYL